MKRSSGIIAVALSICLSTLACGNEAQPTSDVDEPVASPRPTSAAEVRKRGDRLLGIDVNEGDQGDFERAFTTAMDAGIDFVSLTIYWDDFETAPGTYAPEINWLDIADSYYSAAGIDVALVIAPIDTNVLHVPNDLAGIPFDDAEMITRFQSFIEYTLSQLASVELVSISIGNEIDAYLASDPARWQAYEVFYSKAAEHIRSIHPGYKIGVKSMFDGLIHAHPDELREMNQHSDVILTTYYPLESDFSVRSPDTVFNDFELITSAYPDKPIYFLEIGYPSSNTSGSSEDAQASFVVNVFEAWDDHSQQIEVMNFTWLHDISPAEVDYFTSYYGIRSEKFIAYLGSLGLRHADGTEKQAFTELEREAAARGW
jgi:hypothetical protein